MEGDGIRILEFGVIQETSVSCIDGLGEINIPV